MPIGHLLDVGPLARGVTSDKASVCTDAVLEVG